MDSMVDPSADVIWESVSVTVDAKGVHEKFPQSDDEWREVRRRAITLLEATNLLLIPGRHVARPGEKSENPNIELDPEQIEVLVNRDRETFNRLAHQLHDAVMVSLRAIEARDKEAIMESGDAIDRACESCHLKYWYPEDEQNRRLEQQPTPSKSKNPF